GLASPTLEPLAGEPWRSMVPEANSIASARLVFPAPAGPTSAIARVPLAIAPLGMRLSSVRLCGRRVAEKRSQALSKRPASDSRKQLARGCVDKSVIATSARDEPIMAAVPDCRPRTAQCGDYEGSVLGLGKPHPI